MFPAGMESVAGCLVLSCSGQRTPSGAEPLSTCPDGPGIGAGRKVSSWMEVFTTLTCKYFLELSSNTYFILFKQNIDNFLLSADRNIFQ